MIYKKRCCTKRKYIILLIITINVIISALASSRVDVNLYSHLQSHSPEEYVDLGLSCIDPDSAMAYYSLAIQSYESSPKRENVHHYIRALNCAGYTSLFSYRDFNRSCHYLLVAEQIATENGDSAMLALITLNLANLYVGTNSKHEALKCYRRSMRLSLEEGDTLCYLTGYVGLLPQLIVENALDEAIEDLEKFSTMELSDVPLSKFSHKLTEGLLLQKEGKYDEAIEKFSDSYNYIDTPFTPERYRIIPLIMQSDTYKKMGLSQKGIDCALSGIPMLDNEGKIDLYLWISRLYGEIGDTIKSEHYRLLYIENAYDAGIITQRPSDVVLAKSTFESNNLHHDIERLEEENRIKKAILWVSGLWCIIITILLIWLWIAHKKLKLSRENLFKKNQTIVESKPRAIEIMDTSTKQNECEGETQMLHNIAKQINEFVTHSTEPFNSDFTINRLASLLNEHPRRISKTINECLNKNFNSWLSEIRIDEACRRLVDFEHYGNISIAGIAEGLGFKSRTHFAEVFKRLTGLSPSEYQRMARKNKAASSEKTSI